MGFNPLNLDFFKHTAEAFNVISVLAEEIKKNPDISLKDALRKSMGEEVFQVALDFVNKQKNLSEYEKLKIMIEVFEKISKKREAKEPQS